MVGDYDNRAGSRDSGPSDAARGTVDVYRTCRRVHEGRLSAVATGANAPNAAWRCPLGIRLSARPPLPRLLSGCMLPGPKNGPGRAVQEGG